MTNLNHTATEPTCCPEGDDPTYGIDVAIPAEGLPSFPQPTPDEVDEGIAHWEAHRAADTLNSAIPAVTPAQALEAKDAALATMKHIAKKLTAMVENDDTRPAVLEAIAETLTAAAGHARLAADGHAQQVAEHIKGVLRCTHDNNIATGKDTEGRPACTRHRVPTDRGTPWPAIN